MKSKKGATMAMIVQAMVIIFLMFMITSTFVMSNAYSIRRKDFYLELRTDTAQIGQDLIKLGVDDFVLKYIDAKYGYKLMQDNALDYFLLTNKDKDYNIEINYDSDEVVLQLKGATDSKVHFIQTLVLNETSGEFELKSWQLMV